MALYAQMKKFLIIFLILFFNFEVASATFYECTYKNSNGIKVVSSFNPVQRYRKDYPELSYALNSGNCKELIIKRYFIDTISCNIQIYKYNGQVADLVCKNNNQEALKKLKEIALEKYGYYELK